MRAARDTGMTLIELVVAMAVFALVAIMGLQALSGTMRNQSRAEALDTDHADLATGVAVLRQDLKAILPMLFFGPGSPTPQSALLALPGGVGMALSRAHIPRLDSPGAPDLAGRVIWAIDPATNALTRSTWPTLTPASATQQRPPRQILEGVDRVELRSYWLGQGWVPGLAIPLLDVPPEAPVGDEDSTLGAAAPEVYSSVTPLAIEVTLITRTHGPITLVESLQ